jgi:hypothetical protein
MIAHHTIMRCRWPNEFGARRSRFCDGELPTVESGDRGFPEVSFYSLRSGSNTVRTEASADGIRRAWQCGFGKPADSILELSQDDKAFRQTIFGGGQINRWGIGNVKPQYKVRSTSVRHETMNNRSLFLGSSRQRTGHKRQIETPESATK